MFGLGAASLLALGVTTGPRNAAAAWEPKKPVELIIMASKGSSADKMARLMQTIIAKYNLSPKSFTPINKPGGSGAESLVYLKEHYGDDHVIMVTLNRFYTTPLRQPDLGIDVLTFTPIGRMAEDTFLLWVHGDTPIKNVSDFVRAAKARGSDWVMAGTGQGQEDQLLTSFLNSAYGLNMTYVPYKGGGRVAKELVGKNADSTVSNPSEQFGFWEAGKTRPLAAFTSERLAAFRDVPTFRELGKDYVYVMQRSVVGAPGMNEKAEAFYRGVFAQVYASDEWQAHMAKKSLLGGFLTGEALKTYWSGERRLHDQILRNIGEIESKRKPVPISKVVWNAWAEVPQGKERIYEAVEALMPGKEYRVALDLSGISYAPDQQGNFSTPASVIFEQEVEKWRENWTAKSTQLDVYILYDTAFFEPSRSTDADKRKPLQQMPVDIEKLRKAYSEGIVIPDSQSPLQVLKVDGAAAQFVFGQVDFLLRTRSTFPAEGRATVAFTVWDGDGRPIDEVVVGFCVEGQACDAAVRGGLSGVDSLSAADPEGKGRPDAAIQLIALSDTDVRGVFRRNRIGGSDPEIVAWPFDVSMKTLSESADNATKSLLSVPRDKETTRLRKGRELYNIVFPPLTAKEGRDAFERFILEHPSTASDTPFPDNPGVIFVRAATWGLQAPTLFPFNMMALKRANGDLFYIGHYFRIETPLPQQSYRQHPVCLANWKMVQPVSPPDTEPLATSVSRIAKRVKSKLGRYRFEIDEQHSIDIVHDIDEFASWVGGKPEEPNLPPTLVSILSHHSKAGIYFDQRNPGSGVGYGSMERVFPNPSAVILNGCDTGNSGAADMIRTMNNFGIQAFIATNNGVPADLAGDFLECFAQKAALLPEKGTSLWQVYYDSLRCLYKKKQPKYGGQILWYKYLGNASLRLCKPLG